MTHLFKQYTDGLPEWAKMLLKNKKQSDVLLAHPITFYVDSSFLFLFYIL